MTIDCNKTYRHLQTTRKPTGYNLPKTQSPLFLRPQYPLTYNLPIESDGRQHNIPKGKMYGNCRLLPDHIVCKITQRNSMRKAHTCDPAFKFLTYEITADIHNPNKTYERNI